ncbi:hypothetical protein JCM21714_3980 [Gracilibacillus boraciitolerans JCM 21714]|uniref:Uncharacterized protein n=1 Tax=Gracilibacillus boraciitolerans JCM 21714 TaxID=1298598 RepID=W4VMY8_9BACI|nr:hypothetical protein [Gracilibacillus boraciitolerans]GAE94790.1 hypothetical protein JCM21714_3980 [Gracilibacillus boraciitolerans JCM 21714]
MDFEEIFTVHVQLENTLKLNNNDGDSVIMISFDGSMFDFLDIIIANDGESSKENKGRVLLTNY